MENPVEPFSDIEIIHRIGNGQQELYEILIRRYSTFLFRIGKGYHCTFTETENLMEDTYVYAYRLLSEFENKFSFKSWLAKIMMNHCVQKQIKPGFRNKITTEKIASNKLNSMFNQSATSDKNAGNKEFTRVLENAIHLIPESFCIIFILRELNNMSLSETAEVLGISENNVTTKLSRAKLMIREKIEEMYVPQEIFEFNPVYCNAMVEKVMIKIRDVAKKP